MQAQLLLYMLEVLAAIVNKQEACALPWSTTYVFLDHDWLLQME